VEAAQQGFEGSISPGALVSVFGENLTNGSTMSGDPALRLAGTWAWLGDMRPLRIVYASPTRVDVLVPSDAPVDGTDTLIVASTDESTQARVTVTRRAATPGVSRAVASADQLTLFASGLGGDENPRVELDGTELTRTAMFQTKPGMVELQFARPAGISTGSRTLRLTANGEPISFAVHWP
jgi:hypothetical protein